MEQFTLEKLVLAGLGGAILLKDRVEEGINQLVNKGDLTKDQARTLVDDLSNKAEGEKHKLESRGKEELHKFFAEQHLVFVDDIKRLENRVAVLEEKLSALAAREPGAVTSTIITP